MLNFIKLIVILNKFYTHMQRIVLLFHGCNFKVICQCIHEKSNAEDLIIGNTLWWMQKNKNDITENHEAASSLKILCSKRNVFKLIYKNIKQKLFLKSLQKCTRSFIVYEKMADFLAGESRFWMIFVLWNRFHSEFLI